MGERASERVSELVDTPNEKVSGYNQQAKDEVLSCSCSHRPFALAGPLALVRQEETIVNATQILPN